jgi:hypothetical protein
LSGLFPSGFPTKTLYAFISPVCALCPTHLIHLDLIIQNNIWWSTEVMKLLIIQSFPASYHFLHLRSKYSSQYPVLRHPNLCSSFSMKDQVSHTHKTEDKITVLWRF